MQTGEQAAAEQATVRRWAWRTYGVVMRSAPDGWPTSVDALTIFNDRGGVRARIVYRTENPHWRAAVMRELAALVGEDAA